MSVALPISTRPQTRRGGAYRIAPIVLVLTMAALFAVAVVLGGHDGTSMQGHGKFAPQATPQAVKSQPAQAARPDESKTAAELGPAALPSDVVPHRDFMTRGGPTVGSPR